MSGRVSRGLSRGSMSVHSQDELCPPRSMELLELQAASSEHGDIEEALREISREISSEFSCARPPDARAGNGEALAPMRLTLTHDDQFKTTESGSS